MESIDLESFALGVIELLGDSIPLDWPFDVSYTVVKPAQLGYLNVGLDIPRPAGSFTRVVPVAEGYLRAAPKLLAVTTVVHVLLHGLNRLGPRSAKGKSPPIPLW